VTPAEVLRQAADLIEARGWWNGEDDMDDGGTFCVITASCRVAYGNDAFNAVQLFERAVGVTHADDWNDAQSNGNVVITRLREVADDLERAS
jgi:hypothetical protein